MAKNKPASDAAARMKLYRQRQRDGVQMVQVAVDQGMTETLLITKQLAREEAGDPQAVAAAIERLVKKV